MFVCICVFGTNMFVYITLNKTVLKIFIKLRYGKQYEQNVKK